MEEECIQLFLRQLENLTSDSLRKKSDKQRMNPTNNNEKLRRVRSNSYDQAMNRGLQPTVPSNQRTNEDNNDFYHVKRIEFNGEILPILLQNANGPCPLLAIGNVLLLNKRVRLNPNVELITTRSLIGMIADLILRSDLSKLSHAEKLNHEHNISDALSILEKLKTGMDINLKFHRVDQFEYTPECVVFDLLRIPLYHGWVIDPQNIELNRLIQNGATSYNQLTDKMLRQRQSTGDELIRESLLLEQFLDENQSQLTFYGLLQLNETMRSNELAVFFRNNHFSTIWKNQKDLLLLVSDQGYLNHPSIVFETLTSIDNDSIFTDGYGRRWDRPNTSPGRALPMTTQPVDHRHYQQQHQHRKDKKPKRRDRSDDFDTDLCVLS